MRFIAVFCLLILLAACIPTPPPTLPVTDTPAATETEPYPPPETETPVVTETEPPYPPPDTATATLTVVVPTATNTATTPPTGGHDVTVCHNEAVDGHAHGTCPPQLPDGPVRDYVLAHPELYTFGQIISGPAENIFPHPAGKHEGYVWFFFETRGPTCHQFTGSGTPPDKGCLKSLLIRVHSMAIGHEARAPLSEHSVIAVAELCNRNGTQVGSQCGIAQLSAVENYGEVHSQYKESGCPGIPSGVYHEPQYSVNGPNPDNAQPPYVANQGRGNASSPLKLFWNSQSNAVTGNLNQLFEIAWTEHAFGTPSQDSALCADEANDLLQFTSTDAGMRRIFVFWTFEADLGDFPRPFSGFVNRMGARDDSCTENSLSCYPIFIDENVPPGDFFYNLPVRNAGDFTQDIIHAQSPNAVPVEVTVPGWFAPGHADMP